MALNLWTKNAFLVTSTSKMLARAAHFGPLKISDHLSRKLAQKDIMNPTEIQEKAMLRILNGESVILNSETGSGKTLCYLLPILEQLKKSQGVFKGKVISSSCALILAPTIELAEQIGSVCKELGETEVNIACGNSPLRIRKDTKIVISMPSFLMNYDWRSLSNIKCVVFDEADTMLVERFSGLRKLLEFYTGRKTYFSRSERKRQKMKESRKKYVFSKASEIPQFVFVGATIPSGGSKTALSLIETFVPTASLIQSKDTHKVVSKAKFEFVDIADDFESKVSALANLLHDENLFKLVRLSMDRGNTELNSNSYAHSRQSICAIVYTNTLADAKKLFNEFTLESQEFKSKYIHKDIVSQVGQLNRYNENEIRLAKEAILENDTFCDKEAVNGNEAASDTLEIVQDDDLKVADNHSTPISSFDMRDFRKNWRNKICLLHGDITSSERLDCIGGLNSGKYNVLVTTNVGSRGLDIPNVDLVVQFDFATNIVAILHRAGRTARAGAEGKVVSFVTDKDKDLSQLFRSTIANDENVSKLFSRRRRLRRRIKEGSLNIHEVSNV